MLLAQGTTAKIDRSDHTKLTSFCTEENNEETGVRIGRGLCQLFRIRTYTELKETRLCKRINDPINKWANELRHFANETIKLIHKHMETNFSVFSYWGNLN